MAKPNIIVFYTCVTEGTKTDDFAARFIATYLLYPAEFKHQLIVICNGGPLKQKTGLLFSPTGAQLYPRDNSGWDIGGYIDAARTFDADMFVCLGESVYFHREGWLKRLASAWNSHGPGMYGPFASYAVRAHLNTTAFCVAPKLLKAYNQKVQTKEDRYAFEHGQYALWRRAKISGMPTMLVTWDGIWNPAQWRIPENIFFRGDQSNCLMFCNHTDRYFESSERVKGIWRRFADQQFK